MLIFSDFDMNTLNMIYTQFPSYQMNFKINFNNLSIEILLLMVNISYCLYRYCDFENLKIFIFHWNLVYIIFNVFISKSENINKINRKDFKQWRLCEAGYRVVSYFALCHVCDRKISHVSYCSIAFLFACWLNSFLQNQFGQLSSFR